MKNPLLLCLVFITISTDLLCQQNDTIKKNALFEISFGQSLLFINNSKQIDLHAQQSVVIPTSAILFFVEFRPDKKLRIPVFFNLPTETKQFLVNGNLVNERASPTFGTGLEFQVFGIKIDKKSRLDLELGPLVSCLIDLRNRFRVAPVIAGRLRLLRGESFVMYLGGSYSVGIDAFGLLYGTGTKF